MNSLNSENVYKYGTKKIEYSLVRSRRVKTCEIIINDENKVIVRSPYSKSLSEIENLLKNKMTWISRKQIEYKEKEDKIEMIRPIFQNNSTVPYLGSNLRLNIIQSYSKEQDAIEFKSNQLFTFIKIGNNITSDYNGIYARVKLLYEKWIRKQCNDIFKDKVLQFSKKIEVTPSKIIIKDLKNRWGSATEKGIINLNVNLVKAPENIIDYIIFHELCHLKIKDHSHRFWAYLRKFIPDYPKYIEWLNINGKNMIAN